MYYIYQCVPYPGSFLLQSVISLNDDDDENKKTQIANDRFGHEGSSLSLYGVFKEEMNEMCY
jgi:hypothetical protein